MSKLLITTQYMENYGDTENPHWKPKGGRDYVVKNFRDFNRLDAVVDSLKVKIETDNECTWERILWWKVVEDDYLTDFERNQLEYEGEILYPAEVLEV